MTAHLSDLQLKQWGMAAGSRAVLRLLRLSALITMTPTEFGDVPGKLRSDTSSCRTAAWSSS